jgi:hypothetical protein
VGLAVALAAASAAPALARARHHATLARAHHHPTCASLARGGQTLAIDLDARVWVRTNDAQGTLDYYGCANARPRARLLARVDDTGGFSRAFDVVAFVRLAGRFAGIVEESGLSGAGPDDVEVASISVWDLRSGRATYLDPQAPNPRAPNPGAISEVKGFALNDRGRCAWVASLESSSGSAPPTRDVHSHDRAGNHVWDTGSGIDANSLDIGRVSFTWRNAGTLKAAPLS